MKTNTIDLSSTDKLVQAITAFQGWGEMLGCLKSGYVPTLSHTRRGERLARIVEAHGFRVYMPASRMPNRR